MKGRKARKLQKQTDFRHNEDWKKVMATLSQNPTINVENLDNDQRVKKKSPKTSPVNEEGTAGKPEGAKPPPTPNFLERFWKSGLSATTEQGEPVKRPLRFTKLFEKSPIPEAPGSDPGLTKEGQNPASGRMAKKDTSPLILESNGKLLPVKRLSFQDAVDVTAFPTGSKSAESKKRQASPMNTADNDCVITGTGTERKSLSTQTVTGTWPRRSSGFWKTVVADRPVKPKRSRISIGTTTAISLPTSDTSENLEKLVDEMKQTHEEMQTQTESVEPGSAKKPKDKKIIQGCLQFETLLRRKRDSLTKKIECIQTYMKQVEQIDKTLMEVEKQKSIFADFGIGADETK